MYLNEHLQIVKLQLKYLYNDMELVNNYINEMMHFWLYLRHVKPPLGGPKSLI